jgi:hypothetical protein
MQGEGTLTIGCYHITNCYSGNFAGLFNNHVQDGSAVVSTTDGVDNDELAQVRYFTSLSSRTDKCLTVVGTSASKWKILRLAYKNSPKR